MPLTPGRSKAVREKNIEEMISSGHPPNQAVAASYSNARRHPKAFGGPNLSAIEEALALANEDRPRRATETSSKGIDFDGGFIGAAVHGRTDKIPLNIASGSYVLPADTVSSLGQGNTIAGAKVIQEIMRGAPYSGQGGPYGSGASSITRGSGPGGVSSPPPPPTGAPDTGEVKGYEAPHMKRGGSSRVPIIAAGGEYVLRPHEVRWIGGGDMAKGHKLLDDFVKETREKSVKTLSKLPGPSR